MLDVRLAATNAEMVNDRAKLLQHRLIARHLTARTVAAARRLVAADIAAGRKTAYGEEWLALLAFPLPEVRRRLGSRDDRMRWLRNSSPFGRLDAPELAPLRRPEVRRRLYRKARLGLR